MNLGNTCYLGSPLQSLLHKLSVVNYLKFGLEIWRAQEEVYSQKIMQCVPSHLLPVQVYQRQTAQTLAETASFIKRLQISKRGRRPRILFSEYTRCLMENMTILTCSSAGKDSGIIERPLSKVCQYFERGLPMTSHWQSKKRLSINTNKRRRINLQNFKEGKRLL